MVTSTTNYTPVGTPVASSKYGGVIIQTPSGQLVDTSRGIKLTGTGGGIQYNQNKTYVQEFSQAKQVSEQKEEIKPEIKPNLNLQFQTQQQKVNNNSLLNIGQPISDLLAGKNQTWRTEFQQGLKNQFTNVYPAVLGAGATYLATSSISKIGGDIYAGANYASYKLVTNPVGAVVGVLRGIGSTFTEGVSTPRKLGGFTADIGTFTIIGAGASKAFLPVTNWWTKLDATKVPAEQIFSKQVLQEGKKFPFSSSAEKTLASFEKTRTPEGKIIGVHTTGETFTEGVVNPSKQISSRYGDLALYFTPYGEGSPSFLKVGNQYNYGKGISLNPFENFNRKPQVIVMAGQGVERLPTSIIKTPGYSSINAYEQSQAYKGVFFVSGRSEKGLAGINQYVGGKRVLTTTELEGVLAKGTLFGKDVGSPTWLQRFKGYSQYTTYEGVNIPIKNFETIPYPKGFTPRTITESKQVEQKLNKDLMQSYSYSTGKKPSVISPYYTSSYPKIDYSLASYPYSKGSPLSYTPSSKGSSTPSKISYPGGSSIGSGSSTPGGSSYTPPTPPSYTPPTYYTQRYYSNSTPFIPVIPFGAMGFNEVTKTRKLPTRKKTAYYPDFTSLWKGIKGRYRGGLTGKSGINFRPITSKLDLKKIAGFKV